jgi:DNA-binding LacI/PurR family transcriptional regulator
MIRERPRARALRMLRARLAGSAAAGEALAPERALADDCGVSRTTIRWTLAKLAEEGRLGPVVGRTRLIADPARATLAGNAVCLFSGVAGLDDRHSQGWGGHVHLGVQQVLRAAGRNVLIPAGAIDAPMVAVLQRERPVGVILLESAYAGFASRSLVDAVAALAAAGIPTVAFGEDPFACDRVVSDHASGAQTLTAWLLGQGRRRHLHLWPEAPEHPWRQRRLAGHAAALATAGLPPPVMEAVAWTGGAEAFDRMVVALAGHLVPHLLGAEPIDAVVALIDSHVPAICAALRRCGREPGRDVVVVGYDANWDDAPERLRCPLPPAATIDKDNLGIGQAMARLLEDRLAGRLPPEPQVCQIATRLVVSQTG